MIDVEIPGWKRLHLSLLVLDVNGVLALDGKVLPSVPRRIEMLRPNLDIHLLSADTYGRLEGLARTLRVDATRLEGGREEASQKAEFVARRGAETTVAIGNGANDVGMLREAALGIGVLGHEGAASAALLAGEVVVGSIHEALDLLLRPTRLVATLRR